jgi:hypothetical protein
MATVVLDRNGQVIDRLDVDLMQPLDVLRVGSVVHVIAYFPRPFPDQTLTLIHTSFIKNAQSELEQGLVTILEDEFDLEADSLLRVGCSEEDAIATWARGNVVQAVRVTVDGVEASATLRSGNSRTPGFENRVTRALCR